ncbi:hypothetical protein [Kitasatospora cineracea]|uniref:hypothetical protein n=1 Tax=Kitasatospora cineracea TaxID=88074 RepID=UPI0037A95B99
MTRARVLESALAVVVGAVPVSPVVLAAFDPSPTRRWGWVFVAVALAMVAVAFGPDWCARRQHGRARAERRAER